MTQEIVIVGASARAAAQSAVRAGLQPYAVDQFNDEDLLACAPAIRIQRYSHGLLTAVRKFPIAPILYTGALENDPNVLAQLARERPILGNCADSVRAVRNPWRLQETIRSVDCHSPELRRHDEIPTDDNWIVKPYHSGGGLGIHRYPRISAQGDQVPARLTKRVYFQRFVPGEPISALYIGTGGSAELLGVTRQLIGCTWAGAERFLYVGNIGSISVSEKVRQQLLRIGNALAHTYRLQGLFGVDAIEQDGVVWVLEVNPRYTAAVEILERFLELSALRSHLQACGGECEPIPIRNSTQLHGKAVLYARQPTVIPPRFSAWITACNLDARWPEVADIPAAGTKIDRGTPLCTIFAAANSEIAVLQKLQQRALEVLGLVDPQQAPS